MEINSGTLLLKQFVVQRVGPRFSSILRKLNKEHIVASSESNAAENLQDNNEFFVDVNYLKTLDPKEWKKQDHYAVLGLSDLRIRASDDDIRRAYRKMVLQHHPDKRKAKGEEVNADDDYFTCITKAYEILGSPKPRLAYDSVDPEFDDSLPSASEIERDYFKVFTKYFALNSRWSEKKKVPSFGDENSTRDQVDHFYTFWYDFESKREFSYLDEEDKDKGQDRDERRWIEKQNKTARIKRKKEENARIRALVDLAYNNDKRIIRFKKEEKERKLAMKRAKMDAAQAQKEEADRMLKEAQLAKEKAEKAEQKRIEQIRYEKEIQKRAVKKERKILRDKAKECNYFSTNDKDMVKNMEGVEKICEFLSLLELQEFNKELEKNGRHSYLNKIKIVEQKIKDEREGVQQKKNTDTTTANPEEKKVMWSNENVQLLIKAVNLFPAGTAQRWEVISTFMNQHSEYANERKFVAKDVLNKAKSLQQGDFSKSTLKTQANESAFESFEKSKKDIKLNAEKTDAEINGQEISSPAALIKEEENDKQSANIPKESDDSKVAKQSATISKTWTKEEQALLEQSIKTYPLSTPDRWDRIAECIPNKSKKDCLRRVKELVELINSKKDAQQVTK